MENQRCSTTRTPVPKRSIVSIALVVIIIASIAPAVAASPSAAAVRAMTAEEIGEAEKRLAEIGYWTGPIDSVFDPASRRALFAFQRITGRKMTGELTPDELEAIKNGVRPQPMESGYAHIEIDLERQVLFVVDGNGSVSLVVPISSGNGKSYTVDGRSEKAITPVGRFQVYRKVKGRRQSRLGFLYYPNYFSGGVAIHGSPSVPNYPASHGCIRVPMDVCQTISELAPIGMTVIVHKGGRNTETAPAADSFRCRLQ